MATPTGQFFRWLCGILAFLIMTLGQMPYAHADDNKPITIGTIINAWTERESRARSLDFVAVGTEFRPQMTFTVNLLEAMGRPSEKKDISVPDTSFNIRLRLAIDSNRRFRMDCDGKAPAPTKDGYPDQHHIEIFDNGVRNTIFPVGAFGYPSGHINRAKNPTAIRNPQVLPILIAYRAFDREIGVFDANKLTLTKDKGVVEDRQCLILKYMEKMIWVDTARDYVPTRYYELEQGVTTRRIDIKYIADVQHGWVPTSWNNVSLKGNGDTQGSVRASVAEYSIGKPISKETFDVHYPPGTWVRDYVKDESYILREDGTRRMVLKSENGKDYTDLIQTNSPNLTRRRFPWIVGIGTLLLAVVVAVLFYRILKRSRGTSVDR